MNTAFNAAYRTACGVLAVAWLGLVPGVGHAQTRFLALAGAPNFRDIGGYSTTDGRHVKWRQVYRSGLLARLTPADYEKVAALGITLVCDFRSDNERKASPTNWQGGIRPQFFESGVVNNSAKTGRDLMEAGGTTEEIKAAWRASYAEAVDRQTPAFKSAIHLILEAPGPVLYHCSGGKDRTGMFSALLLTFLGVKDSEVTGDFLLTNSVPPPASFIEVAEKVHASKETLQAAAGIEADYLKLFFRTIDEKFGSLDNYRRTALGVSDSQLAMLKTRLLE